jgi:hypothetical protein
MRRTDLHRANLKVARRRWGFGRGHIALQILRMYSEEYRFSLSTGDLLILRPELVCHPCWPIEAVAPQALSWDRSTSSARAM